MQKIYNFLNDALASLGAAPNSISFLTAVLLVFFSALVLAMLYYLMSRVFEPLIYNITRRTPNKWDDIVFRHKAIRWVWLLIVSIVGYHMLPVSLAPYPTLAAIANVVMRVSIVLTFMMTTIETVKSVFLVIADHENLEKVAVQMHMAKDNGEDFVYTPSHSLKGLQQMITIIIVGIAVILIISILAGKDPLIIFSGLGAAAAVLMLIFQDSILGVVAGVQITANDMLQPGDWIMAPKYAANGIVKEVTLAAVKVQNWDKTIVTIPPYRLLTEGFQNWRGMQESGGRLIARSVCIDMSTVRYCTDAEIEKWQDKAWWRKPIGGNKQVNISAFRNYLEHYITHLPSMLDNMYFMVRELPPTQFGLPIEVYFFTSHQEWHSYEIEQASVIDQILAVLPEFGLRAYQAPAAFDFRHQTSASSAL